MFLHSDPSLFRWFCEFVCITMDNDLSDAIHLQSLYCISFQAHFHMAYGYGYENVFKAKTLSNEWDV